MSYDPFTEWRGKHTPYWLDVPRPDIEARHRMYVEQMERAYREQVSRQQSEDRARHGKVADGPSAAGPATPYS